MPLLHTDSEVRLLNISFPLRNVTAHLSTARFIFFMLLPCQKVTLFFLPQVGLLLWCGFSWYLLPPGPQKKLKSILYYYIDIVE